MKSLVAKSPAKIQIWKQFTTAMINYLVEHSLPNLLQRYKFESNSQHSARSAAVSLRCQISCKDTNLKAIHNFIAIWINFRNVAKSPAKIQIWKQFTTSFKTHLYYQMLPNLLQRYKFESNSQLAKRENAAQAGCQISCKDTNLKAIHNYCTKFYDFHNVAKSPAKIQIWKQFTT